MGRHKIIASLLAIFIGFNIFSQTLDYNCKLYDQHVALSIYNLQLNSIEELDSLINNIKNKDAVSFYPIFDLKYNFLQDTCGCFISLKPTLLKFEELHRSQDSAIFSNKDYKVIIKTQEINIKKTNNTLFNKWDYNYKTYYEAIGSVDNEYKYPLYGYGGSDSIRVIKNISIKYNNGYVFELDTSYFNKLVNPNMDFKIKNRDAIVDVYETPDKRFTYIYIIGLDPYLDSQDKDVGLTSQLLSYYTKIVIDNSRFYNRVRCVTTIPPNVLYRYQMLGISSQVYNFSGF